MSRSRLPTGIQTFRELRESGCCYGDKTGYALQMAEQGKHYFLSRPRRFGKSLFLDTLKELFEGVDACDHWEWSVRVSFGTGNFKVPGYVEANLTAQLDAIEDEAGVQGRYNAGPERFRHLLRAIHHQTGQQVSPHGETSGGACSAYPWRRWWSGASMPRRWGDAGQRPAAVGLRCRRHRDRALLFQTGYLTVLGEEGLADEPIYRLGYPNRDVPKSLNECLLDCLTGDMLGRVEHSVRLEQLLRAGDLAGLERQIRASFASIPHHWHAHNEIARYGRPDVWLCARAAITMFAFGPGAPDPAAKRWRPR